MRVGRFEDALALLDGLLDQQPANCKLLRFKHLALMGLRRFDAAVEIIAAALAIQPDNSFYRKLHAIAVKDAGKTAVALPLLNDLHERDPTDLEVLAALCVCHFRLEDEAEAVRLGQLKLDRLAELYSSSQAAGSPLPRTGSPKRRVVAMSLWGNSPQYCQGAILNARSIPELLPGWTARFYCRADVPDEVTRELADAGSEVVQGEELDAIAPLMWRFLVHDDAEVDLYACRDSDSRIGEREIAAMMEWIESGRAFHVMRDHPFHNELMMGGMWGGTARTAFSMMAEIDAFRQLHGPEHRYGVDQAFLAARIWPLIKDQLCTHDSYYRVGETRPFPGGARGTDRDHVGMGIVLAQ